MNDLVFMNVHRFHSPMDPRFERIVPGQNTIAELDAIDANCSIRSSDKRVASQASTSCLGVSNGSEYRRNYDGCCTYNE